MTQPLLTGQLFMRQSVAKDGRTLFIVAGILAVPKGQEWLGEHQYTVMGMENTCLIIDTTAPIDRTARAKGWGIDGLLTSPLWRV